MNITLTKRLCLTAMLTLAAAVYTSSAFAETVNWSLSPGTVRKAVNRLQWKRNNGTIRASYVRK